MIRADVSYEERDMYISCYHGQRCRPTRGFQRRGTQAQRRGRLNKYVSTSSQPIGRGHVPGAPAPTL